MGPWCHSPSTVCLKRINRVYLLTLNDLDRLAEYILLVHWSIPLLSEPVRPGLLQRAGQWRILAVVLDGR